jgi:hypothetical protein
MIARMGGFGAPFLDDAVACLPPGRRRLAYDVPERTGEMRLITHAAAQGNLAQRGARREHKALGKFDAPAPDPTSSGHIERAFESAAEVPDAHVEQGSKVFDEDLAGEVRLDMRREAP